MAVTGQSILVSWILENSKCLSICLNCSHFIVFCTRNHCEEFIRAKAEHTAMCCNKRAIQRSDGVRESSLIN